MNIRRLLVTGLAVLGLTAVAHVPAARAQVSPGLIPPIDPSNPVIPSVPYIEVPEPLKPVTALTSPLAPTTCTAAFLVPLVGVVVVATLFAESPVTPPISPGALLPAFSGMFTLCNITQPFPAMTSCDPDYQLRAQAAALPAPPTSDLPPAVAGALPVAVPAVDVVGLLPPPVASLVSEIYAVQALVEGTTGRSMPVNLAEDTRVYFTCQ